MAERILIVVNPFLTQEMKSQICDTAQSLGFVPLFFDSDAETADRIRAAEAASGYGTWLTKEGTNLKWFHSMSAGIDAYQAPGAIASSGMILTHSVGAYGVTLAEHTLMTLLMVLRREPEYLDAVRSHIWLKRQRVRGIIGSRVTILGTGDIGQSIAARLRPFMPGTITGVNRSGKEPVFGPGVAGRECAEPVFDRVIRKEGLSEVLKDTDILIMALPGGEETFHYIGEKELALLPDEAVVVNVGRGTCLDTKALEETLRAGRLWGAALDVFETEPLPADCSLWDCPRLLITPHMAGGPTLAHTSQMITDQLCENLRLYAAGQLS